MRRGRRGTLSVLLLALAALATVLAGAAACGDDDIPASTPQRLTLRIAIVQSLTGAGAAYGNSAVQGAQLAIDEINASGTLQIVAGVVDDESTPEGAKKAFEAAVLSKVSTIIGPTLSNAAPDAHRAAQAAGIPVLAATTTGSGITDTGDQIFRVALAEDVVVPATLQYVAKQTSLKHAVLILDSSDAFSRSSADAMRKGVAAAGGAVANEIDVASTDIATALKGVDAASVDAFLVTPLVTKAGDIVKAIRAAGFTQTIVGGNSFNTPDIAKQAGAAIEGAYVGAAWNAGRTDAVSQAFVAAFTKRYGHAPDLFAAQGYASITILADAARRAASDDPARLRAALAATSGLKTVLGDLSFSPKREAVHPPVVQQYRGGQLVVVQ